jgi:hypothetical protein
VTVRVVFVVTVMDVGLAANAVVLAKELGTLFHPFTRLLTFALPRPVTAL